MNPSFLGHRQQHAQGSACTSILFVPEFEHEKAGLLVFQNETHFYFLCKSLAGIEPAIQLYQSQNEESPIGQMELIASEGISVDQVEKEVKGSSK